MEMRPGLVAVALQIRHERRAAGADGGRIDRAGLRLLEDVARGNTRGAWRASGDRPSSKQRARARLAMVHACAACTQAVELLYKANGGASVYVGNAFDCRLRDIQTANQHTTVSLKTWEVTGRVLLGLEQACCSEERRALSPECSTRFRWADSPTPRRASASTASRIGAAQ
jgi:Acyl-CoA dehydrogenase, C-terminal domain